MNNIYANKYIVYREAVIDFLALSYLYFVPTNITMAGHMLTIPFYAVLEASKGYCVKEEIN